MLTESWSRNPRHSGGIGPPSRTQPCFACACCCRPGRTASHLGVTTSVGPMRRRRATIFWISSPSAKAGGVSTSSPGRSSAPGLRTMPTA
ncbi:hypothetical protein [Novosphingobium soli]|uniref:hypothetical protein n=1 Tax=Novosphingobium soli TaxID=574956 RepID=UPI003631F6A1